MGARGFLTFALFVTLHGQTLERHPFLMDKFRRKCVRVATLVRMIDAYFRALAETMARESALMGQLFTHRGKLGENREALLARFLSTYLPARYGVSSGFALLGARLSTQQDVIVYDRQDNPVLFPTGAAPLFPPSALAAVVEVKSRLTKHELESASARASYLKRELRRAFVHHPHPPEREALAVLFAFRSVPGPASVLNQLRDIEQRAGTQVDDRLDLICILDVGVVVGGSLFAKTLRDRGGRFVDVDAVAVAVDDSLLVFYTRLVDYLAARPTVAPQLMSYLPPTTPMGVVVATG